MEENIVTVIVVAPMKRDIGLSRCVSTCVCSAWESQGKPRRVGGHLVVPLKNCFQLY